MALSEGTQEAVRDLRAIGLQHGRIAGSVEVEPDPGALSEPPDAVAVEFAGSPSVTVELDGGLQDTVTVEEVMSFEVPRRDTLALVDAVLGGRARIRRDQGDRWSWLRTILMIPFARFMTPFTNVLVVPVPGRPDYELAVPFEPLGGGWLSTVTAER